MSSQRVSSNRVTSSKHSTEKKIHKEKGKDFGKSIVDDDLTEFDGKLKEARKL